MSEPMEYRAILSLQTALRAISVAGGYHFDVASAAVKLDPNVAVESLINPGAVRPLIFIEANPETWDYMPSSRVKLAAPITVHWVSDATPTVDESRMQTYFRGCADVEQAIAVDITRGGLVADTRIVKRTFDLAAEGSRVWAQIEIVLLNIRTYGQPNG